MAADSYAQSLADLKGRTQTAQLGASSGLNRKLVLLYIHACLCRGLE